MLESTKGSTILVVFFTMAAFFLQLLHADKTKRLFLGKDDFLKGERENIFIDADGRLQLNIGFEKIKSTDVGLVWDISFDDQWMVVAGGQEGRVMVYQYDKLAKKVGELVFEKQVQGEDIVSIEKIGETWFFGSAPNGNIYRLELDEGKLSAITV